MASGLESPSAVLSSTRKSRLVTKLTEREEADRKERERDSRKALLKEKRNTSQLLIQVRHAASEAQSKVKRGNVEIKKVQDEMDKLEKWRQNQEERLQQLMQQLVEEQQQVDEEFRAKFTEADDIKAILSQEQEDLNFDQLRKDDEAKTTEERLLRIEQMIQQLDDGIGNTSKGGWRDDERGLLDDSSSMMGSRMSIGTPMEFLPSASSSVGFGTLDSKFSGLGEEAKTAPRSEERPVPAPITASRIARAADQVASISKAVDPNGVIANAMTRQPSLPPPQRADSDSKAVPGPTRTVARQVAAGPGAVVPAAMVARGNGNVRAPSAPKVIAAGGYPAPVRQLPQTFGQGPGRNANGAPAGASSLFSWDL